MARIPLSPLIIFSNSDSNKTIFPASPWANASEWEMLREALETRNMPPNDDMEVEIGIQTCNTPNSVDNPMALSTMRSSDGLTFPGSLVDKTGNTGNKQLVRGVYLAKNKTGGGSTMRWCWACGILETQKK